MEYKEYIPATYLAPFVECYWPAYAEQPPFRKRESLIPDGTIELMFNFGADYAQIVDNEEKPVKGSHIIGIRRKALVISQTTKQNFSVSVLSPAGSMLFLTSLHMNSQTASTKFRSFLIISWISWRSSFLKRIPIKSVQGLPTIFC